MTKKPDRWSESAASQYKDAQMAKDYQARDPYDILCREIAQKHALVPLYLEVGCGTGDLTRILAKGFKTGRIDAVDPSFEMLQYARSSLGKNRKYINFIQGTVENLDLPGGYGLTVAADSIHWTNWPVFFPKLKKITLPGSKLMIISRNRLPAPWDEEKNAVVAKYYTETDNGSYHVIDELEKGGYFSLEETQISTPMAIAKSIDDFITESHSRNGCSKIKLGNNLLPYQQDMRTILAKYLGGDGKLHYQTSTKIRVGAVL